MLWVKQSGASRVIQFCNTLFLDEGSVHAKSYNLQTDHVNQGSAKLQMGNPTELVLSYYHLYRLTTHASFKKWAPDSFCLVWEHEPTRIHTKARLSFLSTWPLGTMDIRTRRILGPLPAWSWRLSRDPGDTFDILPNCWQQQSPIGFSEERYGTHRQLQRTFFSRTRRAPCWCWYIQISKTLYKIVATRSK